MFITYLDWTGCILGLLGAYTLALNLRFSRLGWIAFLAANVAYIALAHLLGMRGLLAQQIGFCGSSLLGVYRSFLTSQSPFQLAARSMLARCMSGDVDGLLVRVARRDGGQELLAVGSFEPMALNARRELEILESARAYVRAHDTLDHASGLSMQLDVMAMSFDRLRRAVTEESRSTALGPENC